MTDETTTITILRRDLEIAVDVMRAFSREVAVLFAGYEQKLASYNEEHEALSRLEEALKR